MVWGAEKNEAMKLRLRGYSYNEIQAKLGIPKSTLRSWFADLTLSKNARERLNQRVKAGSIYLIKRNKMQTHIAKKRAKQERIRAQKDVGTMTKRELFILGIGLYWAEGYKRLAVRNGKEITSHVISLVNADPFLSAAFVRFLREVMQIPVEKIRAVMRLYPNINERCSLQFWMEATNLPKTSFYKTVQLPSISSKRKRPYNRLPHGTLQIAVNSTTDFHRLIGWIEGVKKQTGYDNIANRLG